MNTERIVILGGGLAGGTAAMALRENGFDGDVTIVGAESRPPYHRPPLSKGYLRGEEPFEDQLVKACVSLIRYGLRVDPTVLGNGLAE